MKPWLTGPITVTRAALDAVESDARQRYPAECCGLLSGPAGEAGRVDVAMPFDNLVDRYHAADPEAFPRTAREAYVMHGARVFDAIAVGEAEGRPVKALYHSHCDRGAYFSAEDARQARAEGALLTHVVWWVMSVRAGGGVDAHRVFAYDPAEGAFVERAWRVD